MKKKRPAWVLAAVGIWLAYALLVSSALQKSATVDEQSHLFRGVAYLREGAVHFLLGHPLGGSILSALPVLTEPALPLPVDTQAWQDGNWSVAGDIFLWRLQVNPLRVIFLGRLPVIWVTLLLGALVFRWGREAISPLGGLVAMGLLLFDPNVLAHGRFVTDDITVTAGFVLTVYGCWRWAGAAQERRWLWLVVAGAGLGFASVMKFNAALLLPVTAVLVFWTSWRQRGETSTLRVLASSLFATACIWLVGGAVIWAAYGFSFRPLPGGAFWDDLFWVMDYFAKPHGGYLFGQSSPTGWWYYFPAAYLLKTPLPTLLLLAVGLVLGVAAAVKKKRLPETAVFWLVPAVFYGAASLNTTLNIGYRHLLPMLPFLALLTTAALLRSVNRWPLYLAAGGAASVVLVALWQWPHYVPFFNVLAGPETVHWQYLSDSNIDWGQDLPALAKWQQENGRPLKLSYFGMAHPSAYGVVAEMLPTWPPGPEQTPPFFQAFYPPDPAPGVYAISVTNLHGVVLGENREMFAGFRQREPDWVVGGSIFLYEVAPSGPPVDVAFAGLVPAEMDETIYGRFQSNDWRVRWFDARTALVWPGGQGWVVTAGQKPDVALASFWPDEPVLSVPSQGGQALYALAAPPDALLNLPPVDFGGVVALRGWQPVGDFSGGEFYLLTAWEALAETKRPLKLFVHALDENGQIVGQWDGLDVSSTHWRAGDIFVQSHRFAVSHPESVQRIVVGVYDGATLERLADPYELKE